MLSIVSPPKWLPRIVGIVLTCLGLGLTTGILPAYAGFSTCRADPIVTLSDGNQVTLIANIATDAANVSMITYTVHAPVGTTLTKIVYPDVNFRSREKVLFMADQPARHYSTNTVVTLLSKVPSAAVTATVALNGQIEGAGDGAVSGRTGQNLILHF